ncbi:serine/threonine-protein kinase-like protein [Pseudovirgaria hyperparasitica]|uniref:Serine/threonine-protein kinase-like protein n=1 Tax=Pseudovirgaria hyperparasitica TaxID=470096 RepID=A0A6A6W972_9PEZI|nr:serine/threonine-protein kinase-like protein [Pseudovirgaria hyperparasitica]KAF2758446.1 serine/threonine-protein kinase-like protein [Pseudovirgaria hyperparasitica]
MHPGIRKPSNLFMPGLAGPGRTIARNSSYMRNATSISSTFSSLTSTAKQISAMVNEDLPIYSSRDLSPLYEAFTMEDDENGNEVFVYSSFGYITDEWVVYFGQSDVRKRDLTLDIIRESLKRLPDEDVYPEAPSNITVFSLPIDETFYLKKPKLGLAFVGTGLLPKLVLYEAQTMELLLRNPHPHIIRYHGCLIERGRIVSLVLDRLPDTLYYRLEKPSPKAKPFDVKNCMRKIESAVCHLHKLGLAHNDLTPMNVMIDNSDDPVLIDYGSCQPFGNELITAGTIGWIDEEFTTSAQEHDHIALEKIRTWMEKLASPAHDERTG